MKKPAILNQAKPLIFEYVRNPLHQARYMRMARYYATEGKPRLVSLYLYVANQCKPVTDNQIRLIENKLQKSGAKTYWQDSFVRPSELDDPRNADFKERLLSMIWLLEFITPNNRLYANLRYVSRDGMNRRISLHFLWVDTKGDGLPRVRNISYHACIALGWKFHREDYAIKVSGCGMDMGFHTIYTLAQILFGDGYTIQSEWI